MSLFDSVKRLFGSRQNEGPRPPEVSRGISCEEALRLVQEFVDGELEHVSRAEVERHFEVCRGCYPHLRIERCFREAVRRACAKEKAPAELRERVLNMVSERGADA